MLVYALKPLGKKYPSTVDSMALHRPLLYVVCELLFVHACQGELRKNDNCAEWTSSYRERYEPQTVIEESPYMISPEDFHYNFLAQHRPFVMRRAANSWPATALWTENYLIQSLSEAPHVSVIKEIQEFPHGVKHHLPVKEFFSRYLQEDLTIYDKPTTQMLNDMTAPLCLRCQQFMKTMRVLYWLRHSQEKASISLFFHSDEQLLAVLNGSATVTLISPLYSEKLPFDEEDLLTIPSFNTEILLKLSTGGIPHMTVDLRKGDMLYIPQMWWQHITLSADYNLFVQFLWPSKISSTSAANLQSTSQTRGDDPPSMQGSLRSLLRKYEEKFLMMDVEPLNCSEQDKRMGDYTFETGKMTPEEYQAIHNGPDFTEEEPCNFDTSNKQSPCHFASCLEDPESPASIRYILDYCSHWEDRGCTIELPQLLNKMDKNTMEQIATMKSPYMWAVDY